MEWLLRHRQTKGAETDKQLLMAIESQSFTLPIIAKGSRMAMADVASLKGYWRQQDNYFAANPSPFLDNLYELGLNQPKSRK